MYKKKPLNFTVHIERVSKKKHKQDSKMYFTDY